VRRKLASALLASRHPVALAPWAATTLFRVGSSPDCSGSHAPFSGARQTRRVALTREHEATKHEAVRVTYRVLAIGIWGLLEAH